MTSYDAQCCPKSIQVCLCKSLHDSRSSGRSLFLTSRIHYLKSGDFNHQGMLSQWFAHMPGSTGGVGETSPIRLRLTSAPEVRSLVSVKKKEKENSARLEADSYHPIF